MDAETYMKIESLLITATLGLFLLVVWMSMQIIKSKARYIYYLELKVKEVNESRIRKTTQM